MAAHSEPLQGSLFESYERSENIVAPEQINQELEVELSDKELVTNAKNRPRIRKADSNQQKEGSSPLKEKYSSHTDQDLPVWAHHTLVDPSQLTPMLRHYVELKAANPERILLYRLGDFFECFFEDAIELSRLLELTLTGKEGGKTVGRVPMAGIPHHAAERYCAELIRRGLSVSLCDQIETTPSKGTLLKREITRVLTPGTIIEEGMLQARRNNWLAAVVLLPTKDQKSFRWGLASADISTGEFLVTERESASSLNQELSKLEASEVLWCRTNTSIAKGWSPHNINLTEIDSTPFSKPEAELAIKSYYKLSTLDGLGLQEWPLALRASGGLLTYLSQTKPSITDGQDSTKATIIPLDLPRSIFPEDILGLDSQTRRNLELTSTQREGEFQGSLLWALDRTLTSMGSRCLRRWIESPLVDAKAISDRQNVITNLVKDRPLRKSLCRLLRAMGDLERLSGRAGAGQAGARDLIAISDGLERLPRLAEKLCCLQNNKPRWLEDLIEVDPELIILASKIKHELIDNPPISVSEGGLIHDGVDPVLDGLRNQLDDQDEWLSSQELLEKKASGNANLRLQHHRTFGYFLSVSKAKSGNVPQHWIRRQTLSNEERFVTPALKDREGKIFQIKARAAQKEYELFCKLRDHVGMYTDKIRKSARAIAGLDSLASLAEVAASNSYCPPNIINKNDQDNFREINIIGCRHPVVEQMLVEDTFIPNDVQLGKGTDLIILTGPNASGKSCYLRQVGLVQLLAQIGSWVPADKATLSISDRIFTRVGAVDDLAAGKSTFMVEMAETSYILNHATNKSLVLLDEIGRGTATFDGLSIAWAVSEFLAKKLKSRTIFATHYHELNAMSKTLMNVDNFQVLVKETGIDLLFLHKVAPGGASRSYGIEVARLAGVPELVLKRAKQLLNKLEAKESLIKITDEKHASKK